MSDNKLVIDLEDLTPPKDLWTEYEPLSKDDNPSLLCTSSKEKLALANYEHPLLQGFCQAFEQHRPITISPDIIWILIVQGFSHHVNYNAEKLRSMFVNFSGKKKLTVKRPLLRPETATQSDWEGIFDSFNEQIGKYTGTELIDALTPNFSTSTNVSIAVGAVSIMSSMQKYFDYTVVMGGCGLPSVTVEGTVEDWQKIADKLDFIEKFELEWWVKELRPIIHEIIRTKSGTIDKSFWLRMIKYHSHYGYNKKLIDGWICAFYPYHKKGEQLNLKSIILKNFHNLPNEMLKVPFKLIVLDNFGKIIQESDGTLEAGFIGVSQNHETFNIKPEIGWNIFYKQ
ncbi:uncharacterized protein TRFO_26466 [Tritrichomonas foetus]|uniref:DUF4419 domain-containing protein n=1 Tax=Tritrichomonas foetus TaxID=1144522 RepID=A0A1J4K2R5_9EUKA|nr:uncharacterized protein TRFO_26466 [Tritrichomonas foetus]|eukprot:OHT05729.1 uncharacterized protein TRFO_26466 [Tritrichomonas foetus]